MLNRIDVTGYISRINGHINDKGTYSQLYFDLQVPRYVPHLQKRVYDVIQCFIATALDKETQKPLYPLYGHFAKQAVKNQKIRVVGIMKGFRETLIEGIWYREIPSDKLNAEERFYRVTNQIEVTAFELLESKEDVENRLLKLNKGDHEIILETNQSEINYNPLFGDDIGHRYTPYTVNSHEV